MMTDEDQSLRDSHDVQARAYAAVREGGAGLIDLSSRGRIRVHGSEAVQFLNGLITNDMKTLAEEHWMTAIFPNVQGRFIAAIRVIRVVNLKDGPTSFLLDTESATHDRVFKTIERFTLAGDFQVDDVTSSTAQFSIQGKGARVLLGSVLGPSVSDIPIGGAKTISWRDVEILIVRSSHTGEDGFDLITASEKASALWEALAGEGATPVGPETFETLRIEAGIPLYGVDIDDTMVVSETGLDDAISFTKGCYVGQEIVARIKYRGHVAKKITGLTFQESVSVAPGAEVFSLDDKTIGKVTSVTYSPQLKKTIGLALIKYQFLEAGLSVKVVTDGKKVEGLVTSLPFLGPGDRWPF